MVSFLLALTLPAFAQDVEVPELNAQTLQLSTSGAHLMLVDPRPLQPDTSSWRTSLSYTDRPLEFVDTQGNRTSLANGVTQLQVGTAHVFGPVRLGLDLPLVLHTGSVEAPAQAGLGSVRFDTQVAVAEGEMPTAVFASLNLPTGGAAGTSLTAPFGGNLGVSTHKELNERWATTGQLGTVLLPKAELGGAVWGSRLRAGIGARYLPDTGVPVITEWILEPQLQKLGQLASELLFATEVGIGTTGNYTVRPAMSFGVSDAPGQSRFRAMVQVRREVPFNEDPDGDGLIGTADACPMEPEDFDQYKDEDGCPEGTEVTLRVTDTDGFELEGGEWAVGEARAAVGASMVLPAGPATVMLGTAPHPSTIPAGPPVTLTLQVPAPRGTLVVHARTEDGTPISGALWSAQGLVEVENQPAGKGIPVRPGVYNLTATADGFRPATGTVQIEHNGEATLVLSMLPSKAAVSADRIEIKDSVYFETGRDAIKEISYTLLDEVAELIIAHPEVKMIRIEGHTDSRGKRSANQALSQARAEAVRTYLMGKGVEGSRLTAIGYGEDRPLDRRENKAAWEKNRRVDFFVVNDDQ